MHLKLSPNQNSYLTTKHNSYSRFRTMCIGRKMQLPKVHKGYPIQGQKPCENNKAEINHIGLEAFVFCKLPPSFFFSPALKFIKNMAPEESNVLKCFRIFCSKQNFLAQAGHGNFDGKKKKFINTTLQRILLKTALNVTLLLLKKKSLVFCQNFASSRMFMPEFFQMEFARCEKPFSGNPLNLN